MNRDYEMILNTLPSLLDGIDYDVTLLSNASAPEFASKSSYNIN